MKKKNVIKIISFFILALLISYLELSNIKSGEVNNSLYAQTPTYPYKKYSDRKEGLIPKKTLVAGEKLVLISASIENHEIVPKHVTSYSLGFYLKDSAKVKIEVRELENYNYKMEPLQDKWQSGIRTFSWPSEIPNYYHINLADLCPLARISSAGILTIVPIVLFYESPKSPDLIYRFGFFPNSTIRVLEYSIYKPGEDKCIFAGTLRDLISDKIFYIQWSTKDNQNYAIPTGLLILNIKATFRSTPGSEIRTEVTLNYQFYHVADFFRREAFSLQK